MQRMQPMHRGEALGMSFVRRFFGEVAQLRAEF